MCEWALKNLNLIIDDGDMRRVMKRAKK